ncbi:GerMN domain-containing protein [bacterium]|nr:GerMN domain-containing protein [bacterium]
MNPPGLGRNGPAEPLLWTTAVLLLVVLLAVGVLFILRLAAPQVQPTASLTVASPEPAGPVRRPGEQAITLYFLSREEPLLVRETRWIAEEENLENLISLAVAALAAGSTDESVVSPLPAGTRLLSCFYHEEKRMAVLDLSSECLDGQPGDTFSEWALIYGLVNSVASVSPKIEEVLLLCEGEPVEDSPGNWDWSYPFRPDMTFVRYRPSGSSQS